MERQYNYLVSIWVNDLNNVTDELEEVRMSIESGLREPAYTEDGTWWTAT